MLGSCSHHMNTPAMNRLSSVASAAWDWRILSAALFVAAYLIFGLSLSSAPLLDFPNHIARAFVLQDLVFDNGGRYGELFEFHPDLTPYLAGDLTMAAMQHLFGVDVTTSLWIATAIISYPLAICYLLRSYHCAPGTVAVGALIALVFATDWFFTAGFLNYRLSVPVAVVAFAAFERFTAVQRKRTYALFLAAVAIGYLLHLSALIMLGVAVGASLTIDLFRRDIRWRPAILICAPLALLFGLHVLSMLGGSASPSIWGSVTQKVMRLGSSVLRFDAIIDIGLMAILFGPLFWVATRARIAAERRPTAIRLALLSVVFVIVYFALPIETGGVYDVDNRALPYATTFLVVAFLVAYDGTVSEGRLAAFAAIAACALNLGILAANMAPENAFLDDYRKLARQIPHGAATLPVATRPAAGRYQSTTHAGAFATLEAAAVTPYLFAADMHPPMSYFSYREPRPYPPSNFWYYREEDKVDWARVAMAYDFILVTKPFDVARIGTRAEAIAENDSAVLLRITK